MIYQILAMTLLMNNMIFMRGVKPPAQNIKGVQNPLLQRLKE